MSKQIPIVDPEGLLEYSVVFNDRSLNHMSKEFQGVMNDISSTLKSVYNADATIVVPGGGSYGMEAVRQRRILPRCAQWLVQLSLEPDSRCRTHRR